MSTGADLSPSRRLKSCSTASDAIACLSGATVVSVGMRYSHPRTEHGTYCPDGEKVVVTKDGVRRLGQGQQPAHGFCPICPVKLRGAHYQALVVVEARCLQRLAVALSP